MKVIVAEKGGFCWGVRRAMDITMETSQREGDTLYTYGPIIHNPQVIEMLEEKNVKVAKDLDSLEDKTLIIRTHGITPERRRGIKERNIHIKDATCPLVMRVQSIIKKYARKGYHTIIIGDPKHAEIVGLLGFAEGRGMVVSSLEDVERLPRISPVCVVSQTTLDREKYQLVGERIKKKFPDCIMENTICDATDERQTEVRRLAGEVDAMIVVGGRNSANTTHLAEISQSEGTPTFMVETEEELDSRQLAQYQVVGVAAGASTPSWMIQRVINKLQEIKLQKGDRFIRGLATFSGFLVLSNVYVALGAAFMTYATTRMMGLQHSLELETLAFLYFFAMHTLNCLTDTEAVRFNDPVRASFNSRHKTFKVALGGLAALISMVIAYTHGTTSFFLLLAASTLGILYSFKVVPNIFHRPLKLLRLKDIPSSKDFFVALAWCVLTVLFPFFSVKSGKASYASMATAHCFVFILVYCRCLLYDVRDIQGDRMVGRETIPILIGKERTKALLFLLAGFLAATLLTSGFLHWTSSISFVLLMSVVYACAYLLLYKKRVITEGLYFDLLVDGNFIFTGLAAYLWSMA